MLRALNGRVYVEIEAEAKKVGSLFVPSGAGNLFQFGTVINCSAALPGQVDTVGPGDRVLFEKSKGLVVEESNKQFAILKIEDVLAVEQA